MNIIQFPAQITKVQTLANDDLQIRLETQTMSEEDLAKVIKLKKQGLVWVAVSEETIRQDQVDIPDFIPEYEGQKSHSQRLRGILHVYWEQKADKTRFPDSDSFYRWYMERMLTKVKDGLN